MGCIRLLASISLRLPEVIWGFVLPPGSQCGNSIQPGKQASQQDPLLLPEDLLEEALPSPWVREQGGSSCHLSGVSRNLALFDLQ